MYNKKQFFLDTLLKGSSNPSDLQKKEDVVKNQYFLEHNSQKTVSTKFILHSKDLNNELDIYNWRNIQDKYIVKCIWTGIYPIDTENVMIETHRKLYRFTLKDLNKISLTQTLCILKFILHGLNLIYMEFGSVQVKQSMIVFNQQLQVEVWASNDLSNNQFIKTNQSQSSFTLLILELVWNHVIQSKLSQQFLYLVKKIQNLSFDKLLQEINHFISKKQLVITNKNLIKQNFHINLTKSPIYLRSPRSTQKICSFNFIQQEEVIQSQRNILSNHRLSRQCSPSHINFSEKKGLRKRSSVLSPISIKQLKISETTDFTQHNDENHNLQLFTRNIAESQVSIQTQSKSVDQIQQQNFNSFNFKEPIISKPYLQNKMKNDYKNFFQFIINNDSKLTSEKVNLNQLNNAQSQLSYNCHDFMKITQDYFTQNQPQFPECDSPLKKHSIQRSFCQYYHPIFSTDETVPNQIKNDIGNNLKTLQSFDDSQTLTNPDYGFQSISIDKHYENPLFPNLLSLKSIARNTKLTNSINIGEQIGQKINTNPLKFEQFGKVKLQISQSIIQNDFFQY